MLALLGDCCRGVFCVLFVRCVLSGVPCCMLFVVVALCSLFVVCCVLLVIRCLSMYVLVRCVFLLVYNCSLYGSCCLSFVVACCLLLLVVCCVLCCCLLLFGIVCFVWFGLRRDALLFAFERCCLPLDT